jgi:anaerobic selenocysteine-containing dehydrogenase
MATVRDETQNWQHTACILCSVNCGIEVLVEDGHLVKIRGDRAHPVSEGYACQKAQRLDYYQNDKHRLTSPLRRRADGTFGEVSWETAIAEIAAKLKSLRDTHGGHTLAYFGGGGQGNHLGGVYGTAFRAALGTRYIYTSLAQEKTGGFWIDGKLFGKQNCHPTEDAHHADFLLVIGSNPWQSHGIAQARTLIQDFAKDPKRTLVVVDPIRTETAEKADLFLQVRPGGDAHLMLAMLGTIVQEGIENKAFLEQRCTGWDKVRALLQSIPVEEYAREAGLDPAQVRQVARDYARAERACIRTDLGLEHTPHSTLNNYLARLLYLVTGHFGKQGTNVFHTAFLPLIGHSEEPEQGGLATKVTGTREIGKLYPPNVLPLEIDTDHKDRVRGLVVDSGNPALTGADSRAYRKALEKLEVLVVIDVAMTETARLAHYVLPASSQFEKYEATFFNFHFPKNYFHLRTPILPPLTGTLSEPEIYRRLVVAMGELPDRFPLLEAIARFDRKFPKLRLYPAALAYTLKRRPKLNKLAALVVYSTLGKALPHGAQAAAVLWTACQMYAGKYAKEIMRAGIQHEGAGLGEALFKRVMTSESGTVLSEHRYEDTWKFIRHKDGKIHLPIAEMFDEILALDSEARDGAFPFILQAGERRAYNANQIFRSGAWRKKDAEGALKLHPQDAAALGLADGDAARVESRRGAIEVRVSLTDEVRRGMVSLPHGYGMLERDGGNLKQLGPNVNDLTDSNHCDAIAKTPFHKHVPVRISAPVAAVAK